MKNSIFCACMIVFSISCLIIEIHSFNPSFDWQVVNDDESVPPGLEIKLSLGDVKKDKLARIPDPFRLQIWVDIKLDRNSQSQSPSYLDELLQVDDNATTLLSVVESSTTATAMVGIVKKGCKSSHGCFSRIDVGKLQSIDDLKRKILYSVCQSVQKGPESNPSVVVCTMELEATNSISLRGPSHKLNIENLDMTETFKLSAYHKLSATVYISSTSSHNKIQN